MLDLTYSTTLTDFYAQCNLFCSAKTQQNKSIIRKNEAVILPKNKCVKNKVLPDVLGAGAHDRVSSFRTGVM